MDIAAATNSLPPPITHHSITSTLGLTPTLPSDLNAMDHDAFLDSLNRFVDDGVAGIRASLLEHHEEHRWSQFRDALRAGVPSALDYELEFSGDAVEEEVEFDDATDTYEGYDDFGDDY